MNELDEEITRFSELISTLDKGRASKADLDEVTKVLTELIVTFIESSKTEKEAFFAKVNDSVARALDSLGSKVDNKLASIREPKDGYSPVKGVDYFDGKTPVKGVDYFDGETPDVEALVSRILSLIPPAKEYLGEDFRNALEALPEGDKLSISAIEGLENELKKVRKAQGQVYGSAPAMASNPPRHEAFTMNGSDTTITLTQGVAAQGTAIFVRYQGQLLDHGTMYTVNGTQVSLVGFTPENGTIISVTYWTF